MRRAGDLDHERRTTLNPTAEGAPRRVPRIRQRERHGMVGGMPPTFEAWVGGGGGRSLSGGAVWNAKAAHIVEGRLLRRRQVCGYLSSLLRCPLRRHLDDVDDDAKKYPERHHRGKGFHVPPSRISLFRFSHTRHAGSPGGHGTRTYSSWSLTPPSRRQGAGPLFLATAMLPMIAPAIMSAAPAITIVRLMCSCSRS